MRYITTILIILFTLPIFGKVDINTASKSELTKLPGIGSSKADKIIEYRELEGSFGSVDELLNVPGISASLLNKIRPEVTASSSKASSSKRTTKRSNSSSNNSKIDSILARFSNEPTIKDVQKQALKYAHIDNDTFRSWIGRAKNQAWLPKIYFKTRKTEKNKKGYDQDDLGLGDYDDESITTNDEIYFEGKAEFDLRELIFHPDELRVNKEILTSVKYRKKLLEYVTKIYFDRRKNQVNLVLNPPRNAKGLLNAKMKIKEQTSILDALTNGYFSKNIK